MHATSGSRVFLHALAINGFCPAGAGSRKKLAEIIKQTLVSSDSRLDKSSMF